MQCTTLDNQATAITTRLHLMHILEAAKGKRTAGVRFEIDLSHCWALNDWLEGGHPLGLTGMVMIARRWSCVASWKDCAAGSAVRGAPGSGADPTTFVFETPPPAAAAALLLSVSCNLATNSSSSPVKLAQLSMFEHVRCVLS